MQELEDVDAELKLDALTNVKPVQLIMGIRVSPLLYFFVCVSMRAAAFMTRWSFSVHFLGVPAIRQLQ